MILLIRSVYLFNVIYYLRTIAIVKFLSEEVFVDIFVDGHVFGICLETLLERDAMLVGDNSCQIPLIFTKV